ncbi:MAG: nucleoside hydrolase [Clostridia bacterium]|nr:nucleoside hydrolase [Clostridia bacterium]
MKRCEILNRIGITPPPASRIRLIVDTDAKNEADDQYAIMHHLLTPMFDVRGIIATHFEQKAGYAGQSMEASYREIEKVLQLAEMDDVPFFHGCACPLKSIHDAPDSEGVRLIIEEARKPGKLYIAQQAALTNTAAAINAAPDIAENLVVLWNGGGPYPGGRPEFNVMQDPDAVRAVLASPAEVWQTDQSVYCTLEVTLAELKRRVYPCGNIGRYLYEQLEAENHVEYNPDFLLRTGENWTLGDNTTAAVLLMNRWRGNWHMEHAPIIKEDLTYQANPDGKLIRVYDDIDVRMTLEDLYAKLALAYANN